MVTISGGGKLEHKLAELAKKVGQRAVLKVGFLENAKYPDGTSVAAVAVYNEFGTKTIPPRPFFRNMVRDKSKGWPSSLALLLKANKYDVARSMGQMGLGIKSQLQRSIMETSSPPLAPKTIRAKGGSKPLVDTGHMLNSVDFRVEIL